MGAQCNENLKDIAKIFQIRKFIEINAYSQEKNLNLE